jgi:VWFA-related protein
MRPARSAALVALCLLGIASGSPAIGAQQRPTFRAAVDLIHVDVVVLDAEGRPVRGLTPDDFELLDRGIVRPVETFVEVAHDNPPALRYPAGVTSDVASNQSAQSERLVLLVVDDLHFRDRTDEVKTLARRVVTEIGDAVSMGMVSTSGEYGVEITEDRARLLAEIDRFEDRTDPGPSSSPLRPPSMVGGAENLGMMTTVPNMDRFFGSIGAYTVVEDIARMVGADGGRRTAVVWISAGVRLAQASMERIQAGEQCAERQGTFSTYRAFFCDSIGGVLEHMRRSSVTTYTVNPGGPRDGGQPIDLIAEETGGFGVQPDDLDAGLTRVIADLDNYYLLGFYPDEVEDDDYRAIEVRVTRPGVTVRHRRGYSRRGAPDLPHNDNPLGALVAGVMPATDLPLRLSAVPLLTTGSKAHVAVALEIDVGAFPEMPADEPFDDTLEYGMFIADLDRKRVVDGKTRTLEMHWSGEDRARPGARVFQVRNVIDLPAGRYQIRASAISDGLDRRGSVYLQMDVPDAGAADVAIGGLAIAPAGRESDHPKIVDAVVRPNWPLPFPPSLERTLTTGDAVRVFFQVRRKSADAALTGRAAIVGADGREIAGVPFDVPADRLSAHDLQLPLAGAAPGGYAVVVSVGDGVTTAERRVGIRVGTPSTDGSRLVPARRLPGFRGVGPLVARVQHEAGGGR